MFRDSVSAECPQVQQAIKQLLNEDATYQQTIHRTIHREPLARPITLHLNSGELKLAGFCRSVSASGMTIMTQVSSERQSVAKLEVHRTGTEPIWFLAECRHGSPFGIGWFLSSWHLINVVARP